MKEKLDPQTRENLKKLQDAAKRAGMTVTRNEKHYWQSAYNLTKGGESLTVGVSCSAEYPYKYDSDGKRSRTLETTDPEKLVNYLLSRGERHKVAESARRSRAAARAHEERKEKAERRKELDKDLVKLDKALGGTMKKFARIPGVKISKLEDEAGYSLKKKGVEITVEYDEYVRGKFTISIDTRYEEFRNVKATRAFLAAL